MDGIPFYCMSEEIGKMNFKVMMKESPLIMRN
jgi:hypothetical protein